MSSENRARTLAVDDVPENVLLEAVRVPRGYDVVSATHGRAALELAEAAKPDLVLLDVIDGLRDVRKSGPAGDRHGRRIVIAVRWESTTAPRGGRARVLT